MEERKIRVAITQGDTNGVGYEVIMKTFADPAMLELCTPIIYGSPKIAAYHNKALDLETSFSIIADAKDAKDGRVNLLACMDDDIKVDFGQPSPEAGMAALTAIDRAIADYREGLFDVLVTAPVNKNTIQGSATPFNSHTQYLESLLGEGKKALMIMMTDDLKVALVTNHLAIRDVAESVTKPRIIEKAQLYHQALRRDLRISSPRIAVLALNPHAGDEGQLGTEESEIIAPAVDELAQQGIHAFGPYPADEFFGNGKHLRFDGVLAMYHDQGVSPFKTIVSGDGTDLTAGLPLVRTAPAHGVEYDIAGKGVANADAMRHAVFLAIDVFRNRQAYDEPLSNPLPKLYHEKRDDSEKVRFAIPKAKDPTKGKEKS